MIYLETIFKTRIVYKSGYTHDFETTKFSIRGDRYEWSPISAKNKPIVIGIDEIAAVWQLGYRRRIRFGRRPA